MVNEALVPAWVRKFELLAMQSVLEGGDLVAAIENDKELRANPAARSLATSFSELLEKRKVNPRIALPKYLNTAEAALYTGLTRGYMNKLRGKPGGPAFSKPFGKILYAVADLDAWMQGKTYASTAESGITREDLHQKAPAKRGQKRK